MHDFDWFVLLDNARIAKILKANGRTRFRSKPGLCDQMNAEAEILVFLESTDCLVNADAPTSPVANEAVSRPCNKSPILGIFNRTSDVHQGFTHSLEENAPHS